MKRILVLTLCAAGLVACHAPQGKKYSETKRELPPIALPPAEENAVVYDSERQAIVAVQTGGTLTVFLSANAKSESHWRLSQIPDPTVLKLVSSEFVPDGSGLRGQEKWVFQAVGPGEIDLRLWYTGARRTRFGSAPVFACVVAVEGDLVPLAKGPDGGTTAKPKVHRKPAAKRKSVPKVQPAAPDEAAPFSEPVFRSSRVFLRDERNRRQEQG